jgi:hypothetical protein
MYYFTFGNGYTYFASAEIPEKLVNKYDYEKGLKAFKKIQKKVKSTKLDMVKNVVMFFAHNEEPEEHKEFKDYANALLHIYTISHGCLPDEPDHIEFNCGLADNVFAQVKDYCSYDELPLAMVIVKGHRFEQKFVSSILDQRGLRAAMDKVSDDIGGSNVYILEYIINTLDKEADKQKPDRAYISVLMSAALVLAIDYTKISDEITAGKIKDRKITVDLIKLLKILKKEKN